MQHRRSDKKIDGGGETVAGLRLLDRCPAGEARLADSLNLDIGEMVVARSRRVWEMSDPGYGDYRHIFVDGLAEHPFGVPGIDCPECSSWGGCRVLSVECPARFREHDNVRSRWPIPIKAHCELRTEIEEELTAQGCEVELRPGDSFQPIEVDFPTTPILDFFWPSLMLVVSERARQLFERNGVRGVEFCPAVIRQVGKAYPFDRIVLPESGEPEDLIEIAEKEKEPERFGPLYEMVISAQSARPRIAKVLSSCKLCGREELSYPNENDKFTLTKELIPDADVFFLADTLYRIVTDKVKAIVEDNQLTNTQFTEMKLQA